MRVVILPIVTFANVPGESEFVMFRQMARDVVKSDRDAFFYIVVPRAAHKQIVHEPGIEYVFEDEFGVFYDVHCRQPYTFGEMFSPRNGRKQVDAVITSRTAHAASLARSLWDFRGPAVPVFVDESMAADFKSKVSPNTTNLDLLVRSAGYVSSATSFFDTPMELDFAIRAGRRHLSGWALDQLLDKCKLFPCGMSTAKADKARAEVPNRNEKFTLFFGGRLNQMKRVHMLLGLIDMFYKSGRDCRTVICTPKASAPEEMSKMKQLEVHMECPSTEFLRHACGAHMMLNTSQVEGFSIGLMEQIYLIRCVLLPKMDWVKALLRDKYDQWPFLYSTQDEAFTIMAWIYDNWEEAHAKVEWISSWIAEMFDSMKCNLDMFDEMKRWTDAHPPRPPSKRSQELLLRAAHRMKGKSFTLADMEEMICDEAEIYQAKDFDDPRLGKMSRWDVFRWLKANGFRDDVSKPVAVFQWTPAVPAWEGKFRWEQLAEQRALEDKIVAAMRQPTDGDEDEQA